MDYILYEQNGNVATITINREKALNALNSQVLDELNATLDAVDLATVRCLVITGAGAKSFVAGADIGEMSSLTKAEGEAFGKKGNDVFRKIETFPIPVIAAVNGFALGGGCEISMSCDIRICSDNAVFGQPEVGLGITPGFGGTQRLARLVGAGMAKQMIYTARNIKAADAYRIGLVNEVYSAEVDADGNVVASTDPSGAGTSIREEFRSHLEEDVYTDALFLLDSDTPTIVAASSLDGGHGMVQITFSADSVVSLLQDADLANIASSMPLYSSGTTAILEADTMKYISCTDTDLIGQTADFDKSSMKRNKGKFDVKDADGKTNMVHYQSSGDYIIMATVPYAEVYRVRNIVVGWVIGGGIGILAVTCLALRMELLRQDAKNAKK